MGENAAKFRPDIDLDEFERRLRAAAPAPLSRESQQMPAPQNRDPQNRDSQARDPLAELARIVGGENGRGGDPFEALFRAQAAIADTRAAAGHPPLEPQDSYRGHYPEDDGSAYGHAPHADHADAYAREHLPHDEAEPNWIRHVEPPAAPVGWADEEPETRVERTPFGGGRKKVFYGMAAVLALGVLSIGATLGLRGKSGGQEVVTIQADPDPARVKPDQPDAAATKNETLFDRKDHASGAKVVGGEEQPADLGATAKAARVVAAANAPAPPAQGAQNDSPFPTPKRVKTVSVRADGTVIGSGDSRPQATRGMPSMVNSFPPSTPSAPQPSSAAPPIKTPAPKPAAATPTHEAALKTPAAAKPAGDATESGGFAVQLAGSPAESEARAAATTLNAKYASALKGHRATFAAAQVGDKTIYRVRVGHLSEAAAKDMCTAIKGQGGSCFVAKN